jgi:hypothetical protein
MATISMILLIVALVLFVLAAIGIPQPPKFQFIAAGLAFWVFSILLGGLKF